jgi:hypothetical protein
MEKFWSSLGKDTPLMFGRESASAMVWMLIALSTRFLVILFRIDWLVPIGLVFASPYALQVSSFTFLEY